MAEHVCPWWMGYLLISPLRKLLENPDKIFSSYIKPGMIVLEPGSAMGYFTLPLAKFVGPGGRVIAIDLQQKMLDVLSKRAARKDLQGRIETRLCSSDTLNINDLKSKIDLAVIMHVAHEVPDQEHFFAEIYESLKDRGIILFSEPAGHVNEQDFKKSLNICKKIGFNIGDEYKIRRSRSALLTK